MTGFIRVTRSEDNMKFLVGVHAIECLSTGGEGGAIIRLKDFIILVTETPEEIIKKLEDLHVKIQP
jgi:hypothetical protein